MQYEPLLCSEVAIGIFGADAYVQVVGSDLALRYDADILKGMVDIPDNRHSHNFNLSRSHYDDQRFANISFYCAHESLIPPFNDCSSCPV